MKNVTVYIECGITTRTTINTGIQRVVKNIIREAKKICPLMGYEMVLVDFSNERFNIFGKPETYIKEIRIPLWTRVANAIDRRMLNFFQSGFYFRLKIHVKSLVKAHVSKKNSNTHELKSVGPDGKPSVLILLDSNWNNAIWPQVDEFRRAGGKVCAILYDLIPFTHPDTVADSTRIAHTSWWSEAPKHIDLVMCISNSVREEFLDWQIRMSYSSPIPNDHVGYFNLGAEVTTTDPVISLLSESEPYYLVVGSLEPRKNHKIILDAFEKLWENGRQLRLAIVGAYGWKSEELISRIQKHPFLNEKLFLIQDATDRDLVALYGNAEALIIASKAEGFGLPIIEAQQLNCKVICSDIPVFREVASGLDVTFFNLDDLQNLVDAIAKHANLEICPTANPKSLTSISWRQSSEQLFEKIRETYHNKG